MMLYTIMPLELVLQQSTDASNNYQEIVRNNVTIMVESGERGVGRVIRVSSTDPADYLKPEYQPGSEIPLYSTQPVTGGR